MGLDCHSKIPMLRIVTSSFSNASNILEGNLFLDGGCVRERGKGSNDEIKTNNDSGKLDGVL